MQSERVVYKGGTLNGTRHGQGQYNYPGGVFKYDGQWDHGVKHGKDCRFSMPGYFEHIGDFLDGQMTGRGRREWVDGRQYTGDWVDGEMHGRGVWSNSSTNESYEGEFENNRRHGKGTLKTSNGDIYDGYFVRHRFEGRGAYLKENSFIIDGSFKDGYVEGTAKVTWHKKAYYEGSWSKGRMEGGLGHFMALDGSYQYIGQFSDSVPNVKTQQIQVRVDRSVIAAPAAIQDPKGKKDAKKPPAKGKDAPDLSSNTVTVAPGGEIGTLHVALLIGPLTENPLPTISETSIPRPSSGSAIGQIALPFNELRRRIAVRMRPYVPPPTAADPPAAGGKKGVKVAPVAEAIQAATPEHQPPQPPVPIWIKQTALSNVAESWSRFPPNCIKFQDGRCSRTGLTELLVCTSTRADDGSEHEVASTFTQGAHGVSSVSLSPSSGLRARIPLDALVSRFLSMPMPEQIAVFTFIIDLCFDVNHYQKMPVTAEGEMFSIPIFSMSTYSSRDTGGCHLKLQFNVFIKKGVSAPTEVGAIDFEALAQPVIANDIDWANGSWELTCLSPSASHSYEWAGGLAAPENWHSVGISLKHSSWEKGEEISNFAGIDFVVDGANRRKLDVEEPLRSNRASLVESYSDSTSIVLLWLNSVGAMGESNNADSVVDQSHPETARAAELVLKVGTDCDSDWTTSFVGSVGTMAICNRDDMCDVVESTSCFSDWVKDRVTLLELAEKSSVDAAEAAGGAAEIPPECLEQICATFLCRGGYAVCEGLTIPTFTAEGVYVLEISDYIDAGCLAPAVDAPLTPQDPASGDEVPTPTQNCAAKPPINPAETGSLCGLVPSTKINRSLLINVVAPAP